DPRQVPGVPEVPRRHLRRRDAAERREDDCGVQGVRGARPEGRGRAPGRRADPELGRLQEVRRLHDEARRCVQTRKPSEPHHGDVQGRAEVLRVAAAEAARERLIQPYEDAQSLHRGLPARGRRVSGVPRKRSPQMSNEEIVRDAIARSAAVVGLAGVALIHVIDAHDTFVATPYKGWLYVGLVAGSLLAAGSLVRRSVTRAWAAAGALSL